MTVIDLLDPGQMAIGVGQTPGQVSIFFQIDENLTQKRHKFLYTLRISLPIKIQYLLTRIEEIFEGAIVLEIKQEWGESVDGVLEHHDSVNFLIGFASRDTRQIHKHLQFLQRMDVAFNPANQLAALSKVDQC